MNTKQWIGVALCLTTVLSIVLYKFSFAQTVIPPNIVPGIENKKKGDIIALQVDAQVVAWCDFTKAIVVTATNVLCVFKGEENEPPAASI